MFKNQVNKKSQNYLCLVIFIVYEYHKRIVTLMKIIFLGEE